MPEDDRLLYVVRLCAYGAFLKAFGADIFFDDQGGGHCESAAQHVAAAHVPHGVTNEKTLKN